MRYLFPLSPYNQQRQWEKKVWVFPCHLAAYATYLRNEGHEVIWGEPDRKFKVSDKVKNKFGRIGIIIDRNDFFEYVVKFEDGGTRNHLPSEISKHIEYDKIIENDFQIDIPFEKLPFPDRTFTDAKNPRWQSYGNYKFHPATHMMSSNLCWYGKCVFCVDTKKLEEGEHRGLRSVDHVIEEIDDLIRLGFKEVFDDAGTFPVGKWLEDFCKRMNERIMTTKGIKRRKDCIKIGCNMKPVKLDYKMMANAGFRFILVGIESANQETIERIKKGQICKDIIPNIKSMSDAGLEPHGTFMTGYEWETEQDEKRTIELCHHLLRKGYLKTAQASVYSAPRTKPDAGSKGNEYLPRFFDVFKEPEFLIQKVKDIKCWEDFVYLLRGPKLMIEERWRKYWLMKSR